MKHVLPALPYAFDALEPHVDARTMQLHHDNHHAAYVSNLNAALKRLPQLQDRSALWLLLNPDHVPEPIRDDVVRNAGGHLNHSLYWKAMSPGGGGAPTGRLADAIAAEFGSFEQFKSHFAAAGAKLFGSGWVWLVRSEGNGGRLTICTTPGHQNPVAQGYFPLLVNDVWEHAYYLKHQNRRNEFLKGWWSVANWEEAASRFEDRDHNVAQTWMLEGIAAEAADPVAKGRVTQPVRGVEGMHPASTDLQS
jgi:Fe-Mn family superoxide dismutase